MTPFITIDNLCFGFNSTREILQGLSFSVNRGETLAIVGASGAGKSTILRILSGILPGNKDICSGSVSINGLSPDEFRKTGKLAFMFQEPALLPNLTVEKNINLPLQILRQPDKDKVQRLINKVGLRGFENYLPKYLSGGMKTRTSLARAFVTNSSSDSLLLLDEPFSSLDIAWRDALYQELNELKVEFKTSVVLVTHDIAEALKLSDKIICLSINGQILLELENNKNEELESRIEEVIISDHRLRKLNEKENSIPVD